ncbi:hypothetical protein BH23PAT2_BH23PAT2_07320 [soil metagenome]
MSITIEKSTLHELPIIRINDAWLLRDNASKHLNKLYGEGEPLRSDEEYEEITNAYRDAWRPFEKKILSGMRDVIGLQFRQNIIDVYIAPWFNAFSDPMIIGVRSEPDAFVDILTHELLHRLLTDNTTVPHNTRFFTEWKKLYGKQHSFNATVHIPVHAVHKAIYIDILKAPERLKRDVAFVKKYDAKDYLKAWDYVEKKGYKEIITELKQWYIDTAAKIEEEK